MLITHAAFDGSLPPVFIGKPFLYMATLASFMFGTLLCLEWLWRLACGMTERPAGPRDPATVARVIHLALVVSILFRAAPYLVMLMLWPESKPETRLWLAAVETAFRDASIVPLFVGWLASEMAGPMITFQLRREPIPLHLWPTWRQAKRPLKIAVGVALISFALTYLR